MRLLPILLLIPLTMAATLLSILNQVGLFEVANISMVTPQILSQHPFIRVRDDDSVIASEHLLELVTNPNFDETFEFEKHQPIAEDPRNLKFVQTNFAECVTQVTETEWVPIEGCIDNSFSNMKTTATRTGTTGFGNKLGPKLFFALLGSSATFALKVSSLHLSAEKIYCDILPGDKLQIFHKFEVVKFQNLKQRELQIVAPFARAKYIKFSEWTNVDPDESEFKYSEQLACVTDESMLQCRVKSLDPGSDCSDEDTDDESHDDRVEGFEDDGENEDVNEEAQGTKS